MRFLYLLLSLWLPAIAALGQAPAWSGVVSPGPGNAAPGAYLGAAIQASAVDAAGNVIVVGVFNVSINFGSTVLTATGGTNVFVAKWNPVTSTFVWARKLGGAGYTYAGSVALSGNNIYVGGFFSGQAAFGATTLASAGNMDAYVAKVVDAGSTSSVAWAQSFGGPGNDYSYAVAASGTSVYLTGQFVQAATFGPLTLTAAGGTDAFVSKLTDAGASATVLWTQPAGGAGDDIASALAVSGTSVYVGGYFSSNRAGFGTTTLSSTGEADAFVAKLTDNGATGTFGWVQPGGGPNFDGVYGLAVVGPTVYLLVSFTSPQFVFGSSSAANASPFVRNYDMAIAKLTDAGSTASPGWALAGGGYESDFPQALAARGANVYATGYLGANAMFGSTTLVTAGRYDVFVTKVVDAGASGSFAWAQRAGGSQDDYVAGISLGAGTVYVSGSVYAPATFGSTTITSTSTSQLGFLASLPDPTLTSAAGARPPAVAFGLVPNPAHGRATVQLPPGAGPATLTVLDALGRPVRTQPASAGTAELDLTDLAPGLYAVRVAAGGGVATQKLVVE